MDVAKRLTRAFPSQLATPAGQAAARIAGAGGKLSPQGFEVTVGREAVSIPERLYVDDVSTLSTLSGLEGQVAACVLSRHHNGYVRARAMDRVLELNTPWSAPFIVRLVGEYVIEILEQIDTASPRVDLGMMHAFVAQNPAFLRLTQARVTSYWNCYYRHVPASQHVGFRLLKWLEDGAHTSL